MFDHLKINNSALMDLIKIPEKDIPDLSPKKKVNEFYKMLMEQTSSEEYSLNKPIETNPYIEPNANRNNVENPYDERFSNNTATINAETSINDMNDIKKQSLKEIVYKESSENRKKDSDPDNISLIIDQLYNDNNLKKFAEMIRSALSADNKTINENLQKLFSGLKEKTSKETGFKNNSDSAVNDKIQKSFTEQFKNITNELKESVLVELKKFAGNKKLQKDITNLDTKELKEIAVTILDNIKKNKTREIVKHDIKSFSDDVKNDKKLYPVSDSAIKKVFIYDEAFHDKKGSDKGSGRDNYNNSGAKTEIFNSSKTDRAQTAIKLTDFRENLQNIIDKAKISVRDSSNGTFTVKLFPKELGSVNVNLIMENGVITGKFLVDNEDVKNQLISNLSELKYQLEESGISVGEFSVNVNDQRGKFLKQNDEERNISVPVLNSGKDLIAATEQYSSATLMHNGYINMVI
jgi:flagellar hook-length control protein FliK